MIEQLSALLEADLPSDAKSMGKLLELFDRAEAKLHEAVAELGSSGAWAEEGCIDVTGSWWSGIGVLMPSSKATRAPSTTASCTWLVPCRGAGS